MTVDKKGLIAMIGEENAEALIKEAEKKTLCGAVLLPQGAGYQMLRMGSVLSVWLWTPTLSS